MELGEHAPRVFFGVAEKDLVREIVRWLRVGDSSANLAVVVGDVAVYVAGICYHASLATIVDIQSVNIGIQFIALVVEDEDVIRIIFEPIQRRGLRGKDLYAVHWLDQCAKIRSVTVYGIDAECFVTGRNR